MITGFVHQVQFSVFVKAVGMGYLLGIIFSLLMFLTFNSGKRVLPIFLRDVTFFIISAFLCFVFSIKYCSGMLRFYVAAAEFMGFLIFFIFPGTQVRGLYSKIHNRIRALIKKVSGYTKKMKKITKST